MIKYLKDEKLEDLLSNEITLVDFYAEWCGPCKMLGTVLENMDLNIIKVNTDEHPELATKFGVMSIPTVVIFKNKEEITKFIGFRSKEDIEDILNEIKNQ